MGPMEAVFSPGGSGRLSARKFSTVEELVKVIRSAPSARNRAMAAGHILRLGHRAVGDRFIDDGAQRWLSSFGRRSRALLRPGEQEAQVLDRLESF